MTAMILTPGSSKPGEARSSERWAWAWQREGWQGSARRPGRKTPAPAPPAAAARRAPTLTLTLPPLPRIALLLLPLLLLLLLVHQPRLAEAGGADTVMLGEAMHRRRYAPPVQQQGEESGTARQPRQHRPADVPRTVTVTVMATRPLSLSETGGPGAAVAAAAGGRLYLLPLACGGSRGTGTMTSTTCVFISRPCLGTERNVCLCYRLLRQGCATLRCIYGMVILVYFFAIE